MSTEQIRDAISKAAQTLTEQPEKARREDAPALCELEDGLRFRITGPGGELIHTDMPPGVGGGATAPRPGWLMRAALASCNATCIAMRAAQCGIELSHLEVTVSSWTNRRAFLGLDDSVSAGMQPLRLHVKISAPDTPEEELRSLVRWANAHSPVGCTDLSALEVDVQVD